MSQLDLPMRTAPREVMLRERWRLTPDAYWTAFVRSWRSVAIQIVQEETIKSMGQEWWDRDPIERWTE